MKRAAKALIRNHQGEILVLFRSQTHPRLAHDIDLPGGEIEHREAVEMGLAREVVEETGMVLDFETHHRRLSWRSGISRSRHLYEVVDDGVQPVKISWEHESYAWMSDEDFINHPAVDEFMHRVQEWLKTTISQGV
ncbi:hypothetical protein B7Y94_04375 [Candidatus Saccharibacteria bacterium 32-49-12]|nr:MAG: hypothetical protein B7Y94_04375 [Candidatus Saccharibacteria bacterium 32-49-12]